MFVDVECNGVNVNTIALADDGSVWAWGQDYGLTPAEVEISDVTAISAGNVHVLALRSDGTVWVWGKNYQGQFGDGTTENSNTPKRVEGLDNIVAISAGDTHSIALKSDGTVWAWGRNRVGQLGDGTFTDRYVPGQVLGLPMIKWIGGHGTVAIAIDGTVWTWGKTLLNVSNNCKPVDGSDPQFISLCRPTPYMVPGLKNILSIDSDYEHTTFVKEDGTVWNWGYNGWGLFGDGTSELGNRVYVTDPVQVGGIDDVKKVVTSSHSTLALKNDGAVWAWGTNDMGLQGTGKPGNIVPSPVKIDSLSDIVTIGMGEGGAAAIGSDGSVWAWGNNYMGPIEQGKTCLSPNKAIGPDRAAASLTPDNTSVNGTSNATPTGGVPQTGSTEGSGNDGNLILMGVLAVTVAICVTMVVLAKRKK
ncbi:MAG: hypothetical protein WBZ29_04805 [Methanocella sp.]